MCKYSGTATLRMSRRHITAAATLWKENCMSMNWLEGTPPQIAGPMPEQMGTPMMREQMGDGGPRHGEPGPQWLHRHHR